MSFKRIVLAACLTLCVVPVLSASDTVTRRVDILPAALAVDGSMHAGWVETLDREVASLERTLEAMNAHFFGPRGFSAVSDSSSPEGSSISAVLTNRRGTCVGLAIVYLAMAQRLGLDAHAVATPVHLFVRVRLPEGVRNVELMEGGIALDDDIYRRRYRISQEAIDAGVFMRDLTDDEVIAHLLSNQGVAFSKQGQVRKALKRYREALKLHPTLVAAWYNHGIDLMNQGRLKKALAVFDRSIAIYSADAQAHNNRGLVKVKLGDLAGARADFQLALQIDPSLAEAESNLRRLHSQ
jgi:regulator of sirC expression with transglutaminase-like and TPR domain